MKANYKEFIILNWFKLSVIILLIMIYSTLQDIKANTFYTADMVDSKTTIIVDTLEHWLNRIDNGIDSIYRSQ